MVTCDKCGRTGDSVEIGTFRFLIRDDTDDSDDADEDCGELQLCCLQPHKCYEEMVQYLVNVIASIRTETPKKP